MNRTEARQFAEAYALDAKILLDAGRWHAAYYLAGYAVECGLKACILAYVERKGIIFTDKKFSEKCFSHNLGELMNAAGLVATFGLAEQANSNLKDNWKIVQQWGVETRYRIQGEIAARELHQAVTETSDGVLPWIKTHW